MRNACPWPSREYRNCSLPSRNRVARHANRWGNARTAGEDKSSKWTEPPHGPRNSRCDQFTHGEIGDTLVGHRPRHDRLQLREGGFVERHRQGVNEIAREDFIALKRMLAKVPRNGEERRVTGAGVSIITLCDDTTRITKTASGSTCGFTFALLDQPAAAPGAIRQENIGFVSLLSQ